MNSGGKSLQQEREDGPNAQDAGPDRRPPTAAYEVGYGKPPVSTRFVKGQSGNPKGRPRKTTKKPKSPRFRDGRLSSLLEREAFRTLQLHENGKPVELSTAQAILRSVMVEGLKGNRLAKKYAFEMLRQEEREALSESLGRYDHFARAKADGVQTIARCKAQGVAPPRLFPHPDDILLDEARLEVHLLGPASADQAIPFEGAALLRDWFHAYSVLKQKYGEVTTIEFDGKSAPASGVVAMIIEISLPPSFQRGELATLSFMMDLQRLTKRELQQRMQALKTQVANLPKSIDEQLAARERASNIFDMIGQGLAEVASDLGDKKVSTGRTTAGRIKK